MMKVNFMNCPVCANKFCFLIFNQGPQPLSAFNLPGSKEEALSELRFPLDFVQCFVCGHVYNRQFEVAQVPYGKDSNLMFNSGCIWQKHIQYVIDEICSQRPYLNGIAIDIGCGNGEFFLELQRTLPKLTCVGFEPGPTTAKDFMIVRDYFIPQRDLKKYKPSLITCRHVLEHLENPRDLLTEISYYCNKYDLNPLVLFEVPCIQNALDLNRISDFLYEHPSNFIVRSFRTIFEISGFQEIKIDCCYNGEVLVGLFKARKNTPVNLAYQFRSAAFVTVQNVTEQLRCLTHPIYFWGGTGKSASFLNIFGVDADRFPFVVDSDNNKVGRFVPGTGQEIQSVDWLLKQPPGIIVITTPWRAKDIYQEIQRCGIQSRSIVVLWKGILRQYDTIITNL